MGWLVPQADGTLGTSPSTSPENHFQTEDGTIAAAGQSSTADLTIIARLFRAALELAPAGDPLTHQLETALGRLPQIPVAPDGTISEWAQPYAQPEPTHRHVSHLYFAYPGETELTPDLAQAVARTLDARGDDSTGWSLAWKLALRARLKDTVAVERLLALVFRTAGSSIGPMLAGSTPTCLPPIRPSKSMAILVLWQVLWSVWCKAIPGTLSCCQRFPHCGHKEPCAAWWCAQGSSWI
ncbi:hypothetical protein NHF46_19940 [Arthrobacter alpinus]|nr:hypothetical protein [Arthrobacter alpinus]